MLDELHKQPNSISPAATHRMLTQVWKTVLPGRPMPVQNAGFTGSKAFAQYSASGRQKDARVVLAPVIMELFRAVDEQFPKDVAEHVGHSRLLNSV